MNSVFSLLSFALLVSAGYPPPPGPWTAGAWRPSTGDGEGPLWVGAGIEANGGRFWLGKKPSAYCPSDVADLNCTSYPGDRTIFVGGNGSISLNVAVPGGQQGR